MGDYGEAEGVMINLHLAYDLQPFRMSKDETLLQPADTHLFDATFISFISHTIIIEYSKKIKKPGISIFRMIPTD